jgi:hypothetical protein
MFTAVAPFLNITNFLFVFCLCDKIPKESNLKKDRFIFLSWFQRFQPIVADSIALSLRKERSTWWWEETVREGESTCIIKSMPLARLHHLIAIWLCIHQWINPLMKLDPLLSNHISTAHQLVTKPLINEHLGNVFKLKPY